MEFSVPFLRKVAEDNSLNVRWAKVTFEKRRGYKQTGFVNNFELDVLYPGGWRFSSVELGDDEEGYTQHLYLQLDYSFTLTFPVAADTPEGWAEAVQTALADQRTKRWLELDGEAKKRFDKVLEERLKKYGKVTKSKGDFKLWGYGKVTTRECAGTAP